MRATSVVLVSAAVLALSTAQGNKFGQRVFKRAEAINRVDPLNNGFRLILNDEFVEKHLKKLTLPTVFVTAIPLREEEGSRRTVEIRYPDKDVYVDKLIQIKNLREKSWYYVCVEWLNFTPRREETTGTDCNVFRTLDMIGRPADAFVADVRHVETSDRHVSFVLDNKVNFPVRLTAYLDGGPRRAPALTFYSRKSGPLEATFGHLTPATNYGRMCVLEEALVSAYTAMGRLIAPIKKEVCHFGDLETKAVSYEVTEMRTDSYSSFYRDTRATKAARRPEGLPVLLLFGALLYFGYFGVIC